MASKRNYYCEFCNIEIKEPKQSEIIHTAGRTYIHIRSFNLDHHAQHSEEFCNDCKVVILKDAIAKIEEN